MKEKNPWTRRKFSKAAFSLQVLCTSGMLSFPIAYDSGKERNSDNDSLLDHLRQRILGLAMDEIIPQTDEMPSASMAGGLDYIQGLLKKNPNLAPAFSQVLDRLNYQSQKTNNNEFINLNSELRNQVLKQFEETQPELFNVLKNFVYESYYINENIWELIGYEPYPTLSAGPKMEPFDERLLDRVKQLSPFYIKPKI